MTIGELIDFLSQFERNKEIRVADENQDEKPLSTLDICLEDNGDLVIHTDLLGTHGEDDED